MREPLQHHRLAHEGKNAEPLPDSQCDSRLPFPIIVILLTADMYSTSLGWIDRYATEL
jgi:hypothetical protein